LVDKIRRSQEGEGLGTASYAAPEVYHPEEKVTPATDIYSLGAGVWELVTGHLPTVTSPRPSETQEGASTELDEFLLVLMDTTAAQRPSSEDARARAAELLEQVSGSAPTLRAVNRAGVPVSIPAAQYPAMQYPAMRWGIGFAAVLVLAMGLMNRPVAETSQVPTGQALMAADAIEGSPTETSLQKNSDEVVPPSAVDPSQPESPKIEPAEIRAGVRPPGIYLRFESAVGTRLTTDLVESVASESASGHDERPLDFENHLQGACLNRAVFRGERLEWADLSLCN
jgi:serine/threonine protein kinase